MKEKKTIRIIAEVAVLAFLLVLCILPFTTAGLYLKVYFEQGEGECILYYTTKEDFIFDDAKTYRTVIKDGCADFVLDPELEDELRDVRFDFPTTAKEYIVTRAELTSGGWVKKNYDGSLFFSPAAVVLKNDIKAMDPAMQKAVVLTQGDPYVVFSEGRVAEFNKAFSHYTVTKVFIVLFIAATYIFAVKKSKRKE